MENGEYVAFISNNHQGDATGIITLSEGISIYAGGKFIVIQEFYVFQKCDIMVSETRLLKKRKNLVAGVNRNGSKRLLRIKKGGLEHTVFIFERALEKLDRG